MLRIAHLLLHCIFILLLTQSLQAQSAPEALKNIHIRSIGPAAMSGRITTITTDPNDVNIIYAGAASGGVWRSKSGGTNWEPIFDKAPTQSVGAMAINPKNPSEIWVGTGEGNPRNSQNFGAGIFKSIDGGKNWICMGLQKTKTIHRIIIHRDNPQIIWAASLGSATGPNDDRGVFKTTDGGTTWRKVLFVNDLTGCADMVADPSNPNKLVAAMWEYRRWPWFFKSGGKGSGLYVSFDGGENWERRTEKDGLPEGELGRMGVAIARSNPNTLYALVEAKDNALYKSTDGGFKWRKMADKGQGDRPFYYCEVFVDPADENTLYSVYSQISKSIDGGKSFDNWVNYWKIHPDHHAFWINPNNSKHIIDGNDGGLNITLDGGETWRYADNIPVGQFYHINIDNQIPFNIYGGLQDNGSWVGPSSIWNSGGLRNSAWQEVYFGDGFDIFPQRDDPRYVFAMSQGGELGLVDRETGKSRYIKPLHPEAKELRWNWNAGIAQDPFADHGIYFGSQHLHYSPDLGITWQLLSPDLTTNDTSKMHQDQSGGLTLDATNAENHCTIIALAPSPVEKGVIWVGTDDGNVQITRDGGKTWTNCASNLPDCPKNAWVPQIEVSSKNAGEAFVVVNNYRQNDWDAYLYHTTDYGKKWKRLASPKNVPSFCLSVVQDQVEPRLLFLGTDTGLYFSLDYGGSWQKWHNEGFPSVPVQDMKIHPQTGDLAIGTFGRSFWVLDNLAPLRAMAQSNVLEQEFKLFQPQDGILANFSSYQGPRFVGNETFIGENKSPFVQIPVWRKPVKKAEEAKPDKDKKDKDKDKKAEDDDKKKPAKSKSKEKATFFILDMKGDTIRRFTSEVDTGFTKINWYMDTKGTRMPSNREPDKEQLEPGNGPTALPGMYKVVAKLGEQRDSVMVKVIDDPRTPENLADRQARNDATKAFDLKIESATKAYNRLKDAEKAIKLVESQWVNVPDSLKKEALKLGTAAKDSIGVLKSLFFSQKENLKGIQPDTKDLNADFWTAKTYIGESIGAPSQTAQIAIKKAEENLANVLAKVDQFFGAQWKTYKEKAEGVKYSLFKE
ncbi:MAG: hypothetical protein RIR11_2768 [Bacteroidota bacterium]|jgi:hypothetical protein